MSNNPNDPDYKLPERVAELAPSCQHVYSILVHEGPLTQQGLVAYGLNPRTARWALSRLEHIGYVKSYVYPGDARQSLYEVADPDD